MENRFSGCFNFFNGILAFVQTKNINKSVTFLGPDRAVAMSGTSPGGPSFATHAQRRRRPDGG
jgi:hypothetical protein